MDIQDFNESPFGRDEPTPSLQAVYLVTGLEVLAFLLGLIGAAFNVDQAATAGSPSSSLRGGCLLRC